MAVRETTTSSEYAQTALDDLCRILGIKQTDGWRENLAPFASVCAAMITAAASDFHTAVSSGVVETGAVLRRNGRR